MRTLAGITAVLIASMSLWSCDQQQTQTAQNAPPAPPPPCNCQPVPPPVAQVPPPAPVRTASVHVRRWHHHRHHYYASEAIAPGAPGYVSESGAVSESESAQYASASSVSYMGPPPMPVRPSFVDGYGRAHFWSRVEIAHFAHQADENDFYTHKRLKPWRKYGATCDWR